MRYLFYNCCSLNYLPNISKFKTNKLINIEGIFAECNNLLEIPDISEWFTNNDEDRIQIQYIFYNCSSIESLQIFQNGILKMLKI